MLHKSDNLIERTARRYGGRSITEHVRRETWWLFWIIPLYSRDTNLSIN